MKRYAFALMMTFIFAVYSMGHAVAGNSSDILATLSKDTLDPKSQKDTTEFRFKNKKIRITEDEKGTDIQVREKEEEEWDFEEEDWEHDWDDDGPHFDFDFGESSGFDVHWAGFEIGLNNFMNENFKMNLSDENSYMDLNTGKSWNVNLNLLEYDINLIGKRFGVGTGLGFEFNDYRFDNLLPINKGANGVIVDSSYAGDEYNVEKAKLTTTYITVPLIFEYQVNVGSDNNKFFLGAGVIGGLKIGSHTKVVYDRDGDEKKNKNRSDFYLSPFRYGYTVRAGYGFLKLFANYYDTPLFESGKGPQIHPFTVGFMLSF
jgi:hypothetical protein